MKDSAKSFLEFEGFRLTNFEFTINEEYVGVNSDEIDIDLGLSGEAFFNKENNDAIIILNCTMFDEELLENNKPFYLNCSIKGKFKCGDDYKVENLKVNGAAILLPYLRSIISSFTAQAGDNAINLPIINVYNLFN